LHRLDVAEKLIWLLLPQEYVKDGVTAGASLIETLSIAIPSNALQEVPAPKVNLN
jgi:hypothetical protein